MDHRRPLLRFIALALTLFIGAPCFASAQSGSFLVRPAKIELTAKPGETVHATITLENHLGVPATFGTSFEDVSAGEGVDDPVVLMGLKRGPYPLRDLLRAPKSIMLKDGEERRITVDVVVPPDASPGGLYGSVVFSPAKSAGSGNVVPDSRIGVLMFVKIEGKVVEEGKLSSLTYGNGARTLFGKSADPIVLDLTFDNTGTVHLNPYGIVSIGSTFGDAHTVQVDPWYVLPKSSRSRSLSIPGALSYGKNSFTLELNRGYGDVVDTQTVSVWVFPSLRSIAIAIILVLIALYTIFQRGKSIHVI